MSTPTNALTRVRGNVTGTARPASRQTQALAWFVEHPTPWAYKSTAELEMALDTLTRAYAALEGRQIHRRIGQVDFAVARWAEALNAQTPEPVNRQAWWDYLATSQESMFASPMSEPIAFLGVEVGSWNLLDDVKGLLPRRWRTTDETRLARFDATLRQVTDALSEIARPATQLEVEGMLHRSVGLCLPLPPVAPGAGTEPLDEHTLPSVFDSVEVDAGGPFSKSLRLVATPGRSGVDPVERHVAIMALGRMEPQTIPEAHDPWLHRALMFAGVEISVRGQIMSGKRAAKEVSGKASRIIDQHQQYGQHGLLVPPQMSRDLSLARDVQDQMEQAWRGDAARFKGRVLVAVDGATEAEVMARADNLRTHMGKQRLSLEFLRNQEAAYREFCPGGEVSSTEYTHRLPARLFAAAVPQASASVGDGRGLHLGNTVEGGQTPWTWDTHYAMEQLDRSGVTPVCGGLGAGKSVALGSIAALSCLRGIDVTVLDPAGQLARICEWGPIANHAASMHALESPMSPYGVHPRPRVVDYLDDPSLAALPLFERDDQARALAARAEEDAKFKRRALALDCLRAILPHGLKEHPATEQQLMEAIRRNGGDSTASIRGVLEELAAMRKEHPGDANLASVHATLNDLSDHPTARNWMLAEYAPTTSMVEVPLLVITMAGLQLPTRGVDPVSWSVDERLSLPVLALGVHYAYQRIYRKGDRHSRKLLCLDEAHYLSDWSSGRALLAKIERESRRWNVRALIASQDADSTLQAQEASKALISDVLIAHNDDPGEQAKCARLLRVDPVFASEIGKLRSATGPNGQKRRDFLIRVNDKVGRVRFSLDDTPELRELLDTTPTPANSRDLVLSSDKGWFSA